MVEYAIQERFNECCLRAEISETDARPVWEDLIRSYSEPHRFYHNISHIDKMLAGLEESGLGSNDIEFAIWFHDIVYVPLSSVNESQSAVAFDKLIGSFVGSSTVDTVKRLILSTDPSRARSGNGDEDLIIDIDLSILGANRNEYQNYCEAIRKEYAEVPEREYIEGRSEILKRFLIRPIFSTDFFSQLETTARENIHWELMKLGNGS